MTETIGLAAALNPAGWVGGAWIASVLGFRLSGMFLALAAGFLIMGLVKAAAFPT